MKKHGIAALIIFAASFTAGAIDDNQLLEVKGNIAAKKPIVLSYDQLKKLPQHSITTSTRWSKRATYTGPLMTDVLNAAHVNPGAHVVRFETYDNFRMRVDIAEFSKWGVILAFAADGKRLRLDNRGPLWLMYPRDDNKDAIDFSGLTTHMVWAIKGLNVE